MNNLNENIIKQMNYINDTFKSIDYINDTFKSINYIKDIPNFENNLTEIQKMFSEIPKTLVARINELTQIDFSLIDSIYKHLPDLKCYASVSMPSIDVSIEHKSLNYISEQLDNINCPAENDFDIVYYKNEIKNTKDFLTTNNLKEIDFHKWISTICTIVTTIFAILAFTKSSTDASYSEILRQIDTHIKEVSTQVENISESNK